MIQMGPAGRFVRQLGQPVGPRPVQRAPWHRRGHHRRGYAADRGNTRIQAFDSTGRFLAVWPATRSETMGGSRDRTGSST